MEEIMADWFCSSNECEAKMYQYEISRRCAYALMNRLRVFAIHRKVK